MHEAEHGLYAHAMVELAIQKNEVQREYIRHRDEMIAAGGRRDEWPHTSPSDDRLQPDAAARFPLTSSTAYQNLMHTTEADQKIGLSPYARTGQLVSPYVKTWWAAWLTGKATTDQAVNETNAEIERLDSKISPHSTRDERRGILDIHWPRVQPGDGRGRREHRADPDRLSRLAVTTLPRQLRSEWRGAEPRERPACGPRSTRRAGSRQLESG